MEVKALQGDTVDQLCYRHYGRTEGVTEAVIAANPGLSGQLFLAAGQSVEMPDAVEAEEPQAIQLWS